MRTPASSSGGLGALFNSGLQGKDAAGSGDYIGGFRDRIPHESEKIRTPIRSPFSALRSVRGRRRSADVSMTSASIFFSDFISLIHIF